MSATRVGCQVEAYRWSPPLGTSSTRMSPCRRHPVASSHVCGASASALLGRSCEPRSHPSTRRTTTPRIADRSSWLDDATIVGQVATRVLEDVERVPYLARRSQDTGVIPVAPELSRARRRG